MVRVVKFTTSNRVGELMRLMALTPADLALRVGCSDQQIRRFEWGFSNPGLDLARRVAAALGATVDEVFPPARERQEGRAA